MPRVLAQATVDPASFEVADRVRDQAFLVHVTGMLEGGDPLKPHDYEIAAIDEAHAAFEGIERYVAENQRLN